MQRFLISVLYIIAIISAVFGDHSSSGSTQIAVPEGNRDGVKVLDIQHSATKSLLPLTTKRDTALVVAQDGTIYLVETDSHKILWSFTSGSPIYSSYQALPQSDDNKQSASSQSAKFFIDIGQDDWELYIHGTGSKKEKLRLSVEEIIRRTPHIFPDGILLGTKKSTVFLLDPKTGTVLRKFGSADTPNSGALIAAGKSVLPREDGKLLEPSPVDLEAVGQPLYITRTDYMLQYSSQKTEQVLWYLMFADIEASFQCQEIEKYFGGGFSEIKFGPEITVDSELPLHCQERPIVYRIRDRSSSKPDLMSNLLLMFPRHKPLSLPTPGIKHPFGPLRLPGALQDIEGEKELALPQKGTEESEMLALPRGKDVEMDASVSLQHQQSPHMRSLIFLFAFLLSTIVVIFCIGHFGKRGKSNILAQNLKVQSVMPKKKKARKSGINKKSISIDKRTKIVLNENIVKDSREPLDSVDEVTDGRKVGKLFVSNKEIAKGSNGTVVLEGVHDGRPVAVKRLVQSHHDVALKEIQNLIASDQHPNIVRWYGVEFDQDFVYLSLERCTCSLHELILSHSISSQNQLVRNDQDCNPWTDSSTLSEWTAQNNNGFKLWKANGYPSPQLLKLMRDIVHGLAHLHELGIIHRDLKPQNVLVLKERSICAKVSDMGISKRLAGDMTYLTKQATGSGSSGWQAPEQLLHERQTRGVDLFSLGCVLFFCITGGKHPFGDNLERDLNIVNNRKDLFLIENIPEALDLISRLLDPKAELRPKAVDVLHHPLFWNSELRLSFLRDASDRVELEDRENDSKLLKALESIGMVALNGKWDEKMENAFINDIGRYRRYNYDSVRDLLRVIRNKLNHYRELPKEIQGILGSVPEGFDSYFSGRFPELLIEVYKVLYRYCGEEEIFGKYFKCNQI